MIRYYLPSIAGLMALLLLIPLLSQQGSLLSASLLAQTSTTTTAPELPAPAPISFDFKIASPGPSEINPTTDPLPGQRTASTFTFRRFAEVISVRTLHQNCGGPVEMRLFFEDRKVNEQSRPGFPIPNRNCVLSRIPVDWTFPPDTFIPPNIVSIAKKIEAVAFEIETIKYLEVFAKLENSVSVADKAKSIGSIENLDFANMQGISGTVVVSTINPQVILWIGDSTPSTKRKTAIYSETVFACADINKDIICDFTVPACNDLKDNDGDGKTDFPKDPGCTSLQDEDETDLIICSDLIDNDKDGKIDSSDPGCIDKDGKYDPKDNDETDPPIDRTIKLQRQARPLLIIQPTLKANERFVFTADCATGKIETSTCKIETSKDPNNFLGGTPAANEGFFIIAALIDNTTNTISYTIVAAGNFEQQSKLFTILGQEYTGFGEDPVSQYVVSILANKDNDYATKVRVGTQFEQVRLTSTILPSSKLAPPTNGSVHFYLFEGKESTGKTHLLIAKGRHWDLTTLSDKNKTPEPYFSFFAAKGNLTQCIQNIQAYPDGQNLLQNAFSFQIFLDLMTLCQR